MRFRIDLKIFIFLIIFYFTKQIEIYAMIMLFALIHELGHLLAGILMGMKPEKIELMPFGVSISFKIKVEEYNKKIKKGNMLEIKKILVALAGPLTNFIIIIIASNINIDLFKALIVIYTNFLIMIFNLLPIYPLDGGRILKGILHINFGIKKSEFYTNIISKITVAIITMLSSVLILYIHNIAITLIDMYLWYLVIKEDIIYKKREKILENINQKTLENETNS
jgi:stage IV sporulation protein FB